MIRDPLIAALLATAYVTGSAVVFVLAFGNGLGLEAFLVAFAAYVAFMLLT